MKYTFKLIAALLEYPSDLSIEIVDSIDTLLPDCHGLDEAGRSDIRAFAKAHQRMRLLDWQQAYSAVFDVAPVTSLYLFEHVFGSSRKRGAAMSSLKDTYSDYGLEISTQELPDYLPVYLDFLSRLDEGKEALSYLADIAPILEAIYDSLEKHGSEYRLLLQPLLTLAAQGEAHPLPDENVKCENVNCDM